MGEKHMNKLNHENMCMHKDIVIINNCKKYPIEDCYSCIGFNDRCTYYKPLKDVVRRKG